MLLLLLPTRSSARPEVRWTAEPYGGAYPPSSPPPARTPSRHSPLPHGGRTGIDRKVMVDWRGRLLRTILSLFEAKGVLNGMAGHVRASS